MIFIYNINLLALDILCYMNIDRIEFREKIIVTILQIVIIRIKISTLTFEFKNEYLWYILGIVVLNLNLFLQYLSNWLLVEFTFSFIKNIGLIWLKN